MSISKQKCELSVLNLHVHFIISNIAQASIPVVTLDSQILSIIIFEVKDIKEYINYLHCKINLMLKFNISFDNNYFLNLFVNKIKLYSKISNRQINKINVS